MAYVVIVCSRCRIARGAPERAKTASCPSCGRKLKVPELKKYHRTESLAELAEAIGQLNARLKGGLDAYLEELDTGAATGGKRPPRPAAGEGGDASEAHSGKTPLPSSKLDRAILAFLDGRGPQGIEDILGGLPLRTTTERLVKRLEALSRAGILFEPSVGVYSKVP